MQQVARSKTKFNKFEQCAVSLCESDHETMFLI